MLPFLKTIVIFIFLSVYGKANIDFHGERRKEDLIEFVERADA